MKKRHYFREYKRINLFLILFFLLINLYSQNQPYVQILMIPEHNSWDCEVGKNKNIYILVLRNYIVLDDLEITYSTSQEGMQTEKTGTVKSKNKKIKIPIGTLNKPGYKRCKVSVNIDGTLYTNTMTVAFSPELIIPTVNEPSDFDDFWQNSIKKNRQSKKDIELISVDNLSTKDVEVSLIKISDTISNLISYGYLSKPKKKGKYPVVLFLPAAGVKPPLSRTNFINKDAITLSIEIHGLNPLMDQSIFEVQRVRLADYPFIGADNKKDYYFYEGILRCINAADFLTSLSEFDGKNFAVFGGSQGGYLSIATAALHEKVSCLVAFHPAMADLPGYLHKRVGGWPHFFKDNQQGRFTKKEIIETLSYFDAVNFAKRIKKPCFYSFGYNDETCPPTTCSAVFNSIHSSTTLFLTPITGHWRIPEMMSKAVKWLLEEQFAVKEKREI